MEGRQILHASIIANEMIDSMVKKKEKGVLCKLDVEKAYDKLNWKFLLSVLKEMGFWQQMDRLDLVVHVNNLFFGNYQW